jgi:hypothetical protein
MTKQVVQISAKEIKQLDSVQLVSWAQWPKQSLHTFMVAGGEIPLVRAYYHPPTNFFLNLQFGSKAPDSSFRQREEEW